MSPLAGGRWRAEVAFRGLSSLAAALTLLVGANARPAHAGEEVRIDLFDAKSNRTGHAIIDPKTGRVDTYDRHSTRTGYGQMDRSTGRIDYYDVRGNRTGSGTFTPSGNIQEERTFR